MFTFIERNNNGGKNIYIKCACRFFIDNPDHFQVLPISFHHSGRRNTKAYTKKFEML